MSQRRRIYSLGSCFLQREGAGMKGRAGGEDVVDDDIADGGVDGLAVGEDESPGDILPALLPAEPGL
jgi:hypothetical protein